MPVITPSQTNGPGQPEPLRSDTAAAYQPPSYTEAVDESPRQSWMRRHGKKVAALGLVGAVAVGGIVALTGGKKSTPKAAKVATATTVKGKATGGATALNPAAKTSTAKAEKADLTSTTNADGSLKTGETKSYSATKAGTITKAVKDGVVLKRGDVAYEVNEQPVVVMIGSTPMYRTLESGVGRGRDVRLLEENLSALGYYDDGKMVVDDTFDANTQSAVKAWQTDIGATVTGKVESTDVLVLTGPAVVDSVTAKLGASVQANSPVLSLRVTDDSATVQAPYSGRITLVPKVGQTFKTGDVAFEVDTHPVVAVVSDTTPTYRELKVGVSDGDDVKLLKQTLTDLGYTANGDKLTIDKHFDDATTVALKKWEDKLDLDQDGVLKVNQYVIVKPGAHVNEVIVSRGDTVKASEPVFTAGISSRTLSASIATTSEEYLVVGAAVKVEFSDNSVSDGTITDVGTAAKDGTDEKTPFKVTVAKIPDALASRDSLKVTVKVTKQISKGATVVPATALIAQDGGKYAVEVVDGGVSKLVEVKPGLFADGKVAVTGIQPGQTVSVPK